MFLEKYTDLKQINFIDGVKVNDYSYYLNNIDWDYLSTTTLPGFIHGDLQFDNVVYNNRLNEFKYIDWRDSFGNNTNGGDIYYDLSKLYGGVIIPYNLMKSEQNIEFSESSISVVFTYSKLKNLTEFQNIYEDWLIDNGFDMNIIKLITGLIFLNMSPLHEKKFSKMLWFKSIQMLNAHDKY
jgi:thiamine kinase-like enzyme